MIDNSLIPTELSFLKVLNSDRYEEYKKCEYRANNYEDNIWYFYFETKTSYTIDFNVRLEDGSSLADDKNAPVLNLFKSWICIQTHFDMTGLVSLHHRSAYNNIRKVILLIDYFLLNSEYFKLSQYGLSNITDNDLINLLAQLVKSNGAPISIYKWPTVLENYLHKELAIADTEALQKLINENPFLGMDIPDIDDRRLKLTETEIVKARAFLWSTGQYKLFHNSTNKTHTYRFGPDSEKLGNLLFPQTLRGKFIKMTAPELLLSPYEMYSKEFARVPTRNINENKLLESEWGNYTKALRSLALLAETHVQTPTSAIRGLENLTVKNQFELKSQGRFTTVPPSIVLDSLRKAIEFSMSYGPDILDSIVKLLTAAKNANQSTRTFFSTNDVRPYITPKLRRMGVKTWHLISDIKRSNRQINNTRSNRTSTSEFFIRMRANEGLYELLRVLFGAVQFCVGTLMARRQEELIKLISGKVFDEEKKNLIFENGKSGMGEIREKEARPVPSIVVKLIELIESFHINLREIGLVTNQAPLFAYPNLTKGQTIRLCSSQYNFSLEMFCDYIETPLNAEGQRYYFRQHQLRRFFAMLFFWGNSFGKMDSLQWFLGHTDIQHLYHYITESTPGNVLRASKAYYGSELIKTNPSASPKLADLVEKHFGTRNFSVLDSEELIEYIEDLQLEDKVQIEPIFLDGPEGKTYQIAINVNRDMDI